MQERAARTRTGQPSISRDLSLGESSGYSFREALHAQLWRRSRLLLLTGLGISALALILERLAPGLDPELTGLPLSPGWASRSLGHAASLLIALAALHLVRNGDRADVVTWVALAANLVLAIYGHAAYERTGDLYFAVSLILFLAAAFLPWPATNQLTLGAAALAWFAALEVGLYATMPQVRSYWATHGGAPALRGEILRGAFGISVLVIASFAVSRTIHRLQRSAHRAKQLGNYEILRELGSGGMGQVFAARHALLCRPTAVKVLHPNEAADSRALARFEREVKLSATLSHPNTITIYDVGRAPDDSLYYAMEYLEGLDLQQLVERFGPLPAPRIVHILHQVCASLSEAHGRGIIHRDIKPSNIFLTRRGGIHDFVKVLDFGLAKELRPREASSLSERGILFGTPRYLAPETFYGNDRVDGRADLYCLGAVAYWMITARPPFESHSSLQLMIDHAKSVPVRPSSLAELEVPEALDAVIMRCLEKRPGDRYQTACELSAALREIPLTDPWTGEAAKRWWSLHGIFPDETLDDVCSDEDAVAAPPPPENAAPEARLEHSPGSGEVAVWHLPEGPAVHLDPQSFETEYESTTPS